MTAAEPRKRRWARRLLATASIGLLLALGLWIAIHTFAGLGPALADGARKVLGPSAVAKLEDALYGLQDDVNVARYKDAEPASFWQEQPSEDLPVTEPTAQPTAAHFPPPHVQPLFAKVARDGDGHWLVVADDAKPEGPQVLAKTQLHPDEKRPHAVVAIMAMDLKTLRLQMVAGTVEPESTVRAQRPGLIPAEHHDSLVAAFNGGWQAIHGRYGMMVDDVELLPPRPKSCTVVLLRDGSVRIGTWTALQALRDEMRAFRQTPQCLWENGEMNPALRDENNRNWGAAVDGATIIRRSGLGLNAARNVLFYGVGDNVSAQTLGLALSHAGASDVAELDVNWTFPRYLLYRHPSDGPPEISGSLIPAQYKEGVYVIKPWHRDFFYVHRQAEAAGEPAPPSK